MVQWLIFHTFNWYLTVKIIMKNKESQTHSICYPFGMDCDLTLWCGAGSLAGAAEKSLRTTLTLSEWDRTLLTYANTHTYTVHRGARVIYMKVWMNWRYLSGCVMVTFCCVRASIVYLTTLASHAKLCSVGLSLVCKCVRVPHICRYGACIHSVSTKTPAAPTDDCDNA